jgi:hypothetical protein
MVYRIHSATYSLSLDDYSNHPRMSQASDRAVPLKQKGVNFDGEQGDLTEIGLLSSLVGENKDEAWVSPIVQ